MPTWTLIGNIRGPVGADSQAYSFDDGTTDADPGAGLVRLNHATPASATAAYIDLLDRYGTTVTAWIDALDDSDSTVKGVIRLVKEAQVSVWHEWQITAWTTATGYRKLTLTYLAGNGAFADGDAVTVTFSRTGDKGETGAPGSGATDDDAIHDNVAAEISAIVEKAAPVAGDLLVLEDSADSNNKKRSTLTNLFAWFLTATKTLTNKTLTSPVINSPALSADSVDAITEIAAAIKGGTGAKLLTNGKDNSAPIYTEQHAASHTIDADECYGGVHYVTAAATITLPAVADGMSVTIITIGAVAVSVDPNASDLIYLDGVALDDGDKITNGSAAGDIAVLTYYDATGWAAVTNGWTDGGA